MSVLLVPEVELLDLEVEREEASVSALEMTSEEADHLLHNASKRPHTVPDLNVNGKSSSFSIHHKLRQLYIDECAKASQQPLQYLRPSSHLLDKLMAQEQLNTLVLNLYSGNQGYALSIQMGGYDFMGNLKIPYEEDQLLSYVDNEQLPPALTDLLDRYCPKLYYSGCVVLKVLDHRHPVSSAHHVLLRPTTQQQQTKPSTSSLSILKPRKIDARMAAVECEQQNAYGTKQVLCATLRPGVKPCTSVDRLVTHNSAVTNGNMNPHLKSKHYPSILKQQTKPSTSSLSILKLRKIDARMAAVECEQQNAYGTKQVLCATLRPGVKPCTSVDRLVTHNSAVTNGNMNPHLKSKHYPSILKMFGQQPAKPLANVAAIGLRKPIPKETDAQMLTFGHGQRNTYTTKAQSQIKLAHPIRVNSAQHYQQQLKAAADAEAAAAALASCLERAKNSNDPGYLSLLNYNRRQRRQRTPNSTKCSKTKFKPQPK